MVGLDSSTGLSNLKAKPGGSLLTLWLLPQEQLSMVIRLVFVQSWTRSLSAQILGHRLEHREEWVLLWPFWLEDLLLNFIFMCLKGTPPVSLSFILAKVAHWSWWPLNFGWTGPPGSLFLLVGFERIWGRRCVTKWRISEVLQCCYKLYDVSWLFHVAS